MLEIDWERKRKAEALAQRGMKKAEEETNRENGWCKGCTPDNCSGCGEARGYDEPLDEEFGDIVTPELLIGMAMIALLAVGGWLLWRFG
jgi:hypothetical protein